MIVFLYVSFTFRFLSPYIVISQYQIKMHQRNSWRKGYARLNAPCTVLFSRSIKSFFELGLSFYQDYVTLITNIETYSYLKLIQAWTLIGWDGSVLIPRYFMILTLLVKCQNDWNGVIVYSVQCIPGLILALFENVFNFLLSKCN